jgi:hypothetical protein
MNENITTEWLEMKIIIKEAAREVLEKWNKNNRPGG